MASGSIDYCRSRGRGASRSRGCRLDPSPGSGVHAAQSWFSRYCHHSLHYDGHLRFCRNGVLSEPRPHMAWDFGRDPDPILCAVPIVGDFPYYGRKVARGFCSHDDARGRVGDLYNAPTLARNHEAPRQNAP